jgi:serine/threonine-protein kinase
LKPHWGELVEVLGAGATGVALLVRLPDGALAVEKHALQEKIAASLVRAEGKLLECYREVRQFIKILASDVDGAEPCLLLEYAEGGSLRALLDKEPRRTQEEVRALLVEVCNGLLAMHANGHVHRDLKPENLLLAGGKVKIADLGHAHGLPKTCGTLFGVRTKGYTAPEVLETGVATSAADIYSLSVVAREMLLGKRPGALRDLRKKVPDLDPVLADLLRRMSGSSPELRPSAAQVLRELEQGLVVRKAAPKPRARESPAPPEREFPWRILLLFAAIAALAIAGGYLLWKHLRDADDRPPSG